MAAILWDDIFKCIFLNENDKTPIQISLKYVPRSPIDNKPALVQVMSWCRTGEKPFTEPMLPQFHDAYIYIYAALGGDELKYDVFGTLNNELYVIGMVFVVTHDNAETEMSSF